MVASTPITLLAVNTDQAAKMLSFTTADAFRRWARCNRVRNIKGARGRWAVADLQRALDRSSRRGEHEK